MKPDTKVAIVHDWLVGGGAEKVVLELHNMFPEAPIYTSCSTPEWRKKLDDKVVTGWLQNFISIRKFMPYFRHRWFQSIDFSEYDVVISSSGNGEARAVKTGINTTHINYCHAVNQFYWTDYDRFMKKPGQRPYWLMRLGLKILVGSMKRKDYESAQHVDYFIANSTAVKADIKTYFNKDATVIFPPVETTLPTETVAREGFVTMARLVQWKRVDLIVAACRELNLPLTVIGDGPELSNLKAIAGPSVTFTGGVFDDSRLQMIASKQAFIMANVEPFGIAPVEALSTGTPVIALKAGGALDYVSEGKTGSFFTEPTVESLKGVLSSFDASKYSSEDIKVASQQFSIQKFHDTMRQFLHNVLQ